MSRSKTLKGMFTLFIVRYCIMYELYKFSYHETEYNDDTEKKTLVIESNGRRFATQKKNFSRKNYRRENETISG